MKKFTTLYLIMAFIGLSAAQAQVTLTSANMPFGPQTFISNTASLSGVGIPPEGANKTWDYSALIQAGSGSYSNFPANNPVFPASTYKDTGIAESFISNTVYYYDLYLQGNALGIYAPGTETKKQDYNIAGTTGGPNDSCKFPLQTFVFDTAMIIMKFPATYNSAWRSHTRNSVDFTLSIAAYAINNIPCKRITYINRVDTVVGWGTVKIPTASGPSPAYDALMVKRMTVKTDSFYFNNAPAPGALLAAFGLSQGMQRLENRYLFWRPNSAYPALMFNFGNNNFTTPVSIMYDGNISTEIEEQAGTEVRIYPSPASDQFRITGARGLDLSISDVSGRIVFYTRGIDEEHLVDVSSFNNGLYFVRLSGNKGTQDFKLVVAR